jgi:hypothetical protein
MENHVSDGGVALVSFNDTPQIATTGFDLVMVVEGMAKVVKVE